MITSLIATLTRPDVIGYPIAIGVMLVLGAVVLYGNRHSTAAPTKADPRSLRLNVAWPSTALVQVSAGVWRDTTGSYVFSAPYLAHLAEQFPTLDCRRVLSIASQLAMDADHVPALGVTLRTEVRRAA